MKRSLLFCHGKPCKKSCGRMEIKCQFEYSGLGKPKNSVAYDNYWRTTPHHASTCKPKTLSRTKAEAPISDLKPGQKDVSLISVSISSWSNVEKKQLHCISQKILLRDSDIKGIVDYVMYYIMKYIFWKIHLQIRCSTFPIIPSLNLIKLNFLPSTSNKVM